MKKAVIGQPVNFCYMKADGNESLRTGFLIGKATNLNAVLEIAAESDTIISNKQAVSISEELTAIHRQYTQAVMDVAARHGLKYKHFTDGRVFDLQEGIV
jgi:hypothetical protein